MRETLPHDPKSHLAAGEPAAMIAHCALCRLERATQEQLFVIVFGTGPGPLSRADVALLQTMQALRAHA